MRRLFVTALLAAAVSAGSSSRVQVLQVASAVPTNPFLFGLNSVLGPILQIPYSDPMLATIVQSMRVGGWRYPGGTVANYFDIIQGNYIPSCNTSLCSCCQYEVRRRMIDGCMSCC